ncbi:MAG: FkbM family methyltransferase [Firmicutes bacterium]|nr:FkbM family methyltransferase [Bacillota bacterium]
MKTHMRIFTLTNGIRHFSAWSKARGTWKFADHAKAINKLLVPKTPEGKSFVRIGRDHDGGYVMVDDFKKDSAAYSIGIWKDTSWDVDVEKRNMDVFMYDYSISYPEVDGRKKFFKIGICGENNKGKNMLTLEEMLVKDGNFDRNDMILKIDIEGAEWPVFSTLSEEILSKFSQVVVEWHWVIQRLKKRGGYYEQMIEAFNRINKTHQVVHVHGVNQALYTMIGNVPMCNVLEVTYLRKAGNKFLNVSSNEARALDKPCMKWLPEVSFGFDDCRDE